MSDFTIPGVTSKYNTGKMIEELMKVERIPLERLENQKKQYGEEKQVWQKLNRTMTKFRDSSKKLFGFDNPFKEHIANSSNESVLTATATRQAGNDSYSLKIVRLAQKDRFLSNSVPQDYQVREGTYGFNIGGKEISFHFKGGAISEFIKALNAKSKGLVNAKLLRDKPDSGVLLIESSRTGKKNRITFLKDSIKFGKEVGLVKSTNNSTREISITQDLVKSEKQASVKIKDGNLTVMPLGKGTIPISPPVKMGDNFVLEYDVTIKNLEKKPYTPPKPPPGPKLEIPGKVEFEGITIDDAKSQVVIPPWTPPPAPEHRETLEILTFNNGKSLPKLKDTEQVQHFSIPASGLEKTITQIEINNDNSSREITLSNVRAYDPKARGGLIPANPVSTAGDAELTMEGISITRPDNKIDDLIPGVTLNLLDTSNKTVKLEIVPDTDLIKSDIITFVGNYNQLMQNLQILTTNDEAVINELDYLSDEEKKTAKKNLGMFQGDYTFTQLKNRLKQLAMSPYPTSKGKELNMLAQIGVSTNSSGFGGTIDRTKLRGYLEINENKLDEELKKDIPAIKELFGSDTNNDLVIDTGAAYEMDKYISVYTKVGGVIASRISSIDGRVSRLDNSILAKKTDLDRTEQDLKVKYGKMEGALMNLQESSKAIDNFSNRNSNNQ